MPLNEFGIAITGGLLQFRKLIDDLDAMLTRVGENAARVRAAVDDPQWDKLLEEADALDKERRWTVGDVVRLAQQGDSRAEVLGAPISRMLLQGTAMFRETNAAMFPRLVWFSIVVAALSEWEVALRGYPQYLSYHLNISGLADPDATGERLMKGFKSFVNGSLDLSFDFSSVAEWQNMNGHRRVRNLIVHWGGRIAGPGATKAEQFIDRRSDEIERRDDLFICRRGYAEAVTKDANDFLVAFDNALLERFPQLWHHGA